MLSDRFHVPVFVSLESLFVYFCKPLVEIDKMDSEFSDIDLGATEAGRNEPYFVTNYSSKVLVGNWYEERIGKTIDRKAITPGIYGQSGCINELSVTKTDFHHFKGEEQTQTVNEFIAGREKAFSNQLNGNQTNLKLWDSDEYAKNHTTMMDIMYRILPEQAKSERDKCILKRRARPDTLKSFGNQTWTGELHRFHHNLWIDKNMPNDLSVYKLKFRKHNTASAPASGTFKRVKTQFKNV